MGKNPKPGVTLSGVEVRLLYPRYTTCWHQHATCNPQHETRNAEHVTLNFEDLHTQLINLVARGQLQSYSQPLYEETMQQLVQGIRSAWGGRLDTIDYNAPDHTAMSMLESNVHRFSAGKSWYEVGELNRLLSESDGFREFKGRAEAFLEQVNLNYLETEYNLAHATAQNAAAYIRQVEEKDVLPFWQYHAVLDDRTRPAHEGLHGKVFRADDPAFQVIYPPNGWGCRCEVVQLSRYDGKLSTRKEALQALAVEGELDKMVKGGFNTNRGMQQVIFTRAQEYARTFKEAALGVKDNGVDAWNTINRGPLPQLPGNIRSKDQALAWFRSQVGNHGLKDDKRIRLVDYRNRPVHITLKNFNQHISGFRFRRERHKLVDQLPGILSDPDEVYLHRRSGEKYEMRYVKFYKDRPVMVITDIERGKPENIRTWYTLDRQPDDQRAGILIKRKPG